MQKINFRLFKYVFKELGNNKRFTILFILNLAIGLAGFIALDSFKASIDSTLKSKSKVLLGADFGLSARRKITEEEILSVYKAAKTQFKINNIEQSKMIEVFSMVSNEKKKSRLIQIRAIEDSYPFYGEIGLEQKNQSGTQKLQASSSKRFNVLQNELKVWVHPEVLGQLNVKLGDSLKIGKVNFIIEDVVTSDSASGFTTDIAPRIYMSLDHLEKTELIRFGSIAWYSVLFKIPMLNISALNEIRDQVFKDFSSPELQVYTHEKASEQMAGLIIILNDFLGLSSLVALFLAAIGSAFLVRSYFASKVEQIAILLCLGLTPTLSVIFYLLQILVLGLLSSGIAILLALIVVPGIGGLTQGLIPFAIDFSLQGSTLVTGVLVGGFGSCLVCLPFCLSLLQVKPVRLLSKSQDLKSVSKIGLGLGLIPCLVFFWLLSVNVSNSFKIGSYFSILFLTSGIILAFLSLGFFNNFWSLKPIKNLGLRWAFRDLQRDKIATSFSFVAIWIGVLLLNLIPQLQKTVLKDLDSPDSNQTPSFFMFDIQEEQVDPLLAILKNQNAEVGQLSPTIRARLVEVNGVDFSKALTHSKSSKKLTREQEQERRSRNRGFNLSYRDQLDASEKIVEGQNFSGVYKDESLETLPEVSVEYRFAETLGFKLKDTLTFEIDGIPIQGKIVNFRSVKWSSFQPNFFIQFQPGSLDLAPKTFVATVKNLKMEKKLKLQDAIVNELPNVSVIDVSRVIRRIKQITDQMVWALQFMSLLCFISGFVVIYSIANHQASQKKWDIGLLKTLGADFKTIQNQFLWQFAIISFVASLTGITISFAVSFLISKFILNTSWDYSLSTPLLSLVLCISLSLIVTFFATLKGLKTKTIELFY